MVLIQKYIHGYRFGQIFNAQSNDFRKAMCDSHNTRMQQGAVSSDDATFGPGFPESTIKFYGKEGLAWHIQGWHNRLRRLTTSGWLPPTLPEAFSTYLKHIEEIGIAYLEEGAAISHPIEFLTEMRKIAFAVSLQIMVDKRSTDHFIIDACIMDWSDIRMASM